MSQQDFGKDQITNLSDLLHQKMQMLQKHKKKQVEEDQSAEVQQVYNNKSPTEASPQKEQIRSSRTHNDETHSNSNKSQNIRSHESLPGVGDKAAEEKGKVEGNFQMYLFDNKPKEKQSLLHQIMLDAQFQNNLSHEIPEDVNDMTEENQFEFKQIFEGDESASQTPAEVSGNQNQAQQPLTISKNNSWTIAQSMSAYEKELINEHQTNELREGEFENAPNDLEEFKEPMNNLNVCDRQFSFKHNSASIEDLIDHVQAPEMMQLKQDPRHIIMLANSSGDDGEDGDPGEEEEKLDKVEDKFQFKNHDESQNLSLSQEGVLIQMDNMAWNQASFNAQCSSILETDERSSELKNSNIQNSQEEINAYNQNSKSNGPQNGNEKNLRTNTQMMQVTLGQSASQGGIQGSPLNEAIQQVQNVSNASNFKLLNLQEVKQKRQPPAPQEQTTHEQNISSRQELQEEPIEQPHGHFNQPQRHQHIEHEEELEDLGEEEIYDKGEYDIDDSEREDTEIDFIQQVDTDRQIEPQNDGDLQQAVSSDQQIQIKSKQQISINDKIHEKPDQKSSKGKESSQRLSQNKISRQNSHRSTNFKATKVSIHDQTTKQESEKLSYTEVFVWGSDKYGQLGLDTKESSPNTSFFYRVPKTCSFNVIIKQISCGSKHSALLTQSGHLYMMGCNNFGQLGVGFDRQRTGDDSNTSKGQFQGTFSQKKQLENMSECETRQSERNIRSPCLVDQLKSKIILKVSCGANFTMVMATERSGSKSSKTKKKELPVIYSWGDNQFCQLGFSSSREDGSSKKKLSHSPKSNSLSDMVMITKLNNFTQTCVSEPHAVDAFKSEKVIDFSCGENFTVFKTSKQKEKVDPMDSSESEKVQTQLYACGFNTSGQCGLPVIRDSSDPFKNVISVPTKIPLPKPLVNAISQFSAGVEHTLFLCEKTSIVYQAGGQSGANQSQFHQILISEPIQSIQASLYSSAISYSGVLYMWSWYDTYSPSYSIKNIKSVSLGKNFAVIIDSSNVPYMWGQIKKPNEPPQAPDGTPFYQLHHPSDSQLKPIHKKIIRGVTCGDNFVIATGKDVPVSKATKAVQSGKKAKRSVSAPKQREMLIHGQPQQRAFISRPSFLKQQTAFFERDPQNEGIQSGSESLSKHITNINVDNYQIPVECQRNRDQLSKVNSQQVYRNSLQQKQNVMLTQQALNILKRSMISSVPQSKKKCLTYRNSSKIHSSLKGGPVTLAKKKDQSTCRQSNNSHSTFAGQSNIQMTAPTIQHPQNFSRVYIENMKNDIAKVDQRMLKAKSKINGILKKSSHLTTKELSARYNEQSRKQKDKSEKKRLNGTKSKRRNFKHLSQDHSILSDKSLKSLKSSPKRGDRQKKMLESDIYSHRSQSLRNESQPREMRRISSRKSITKVSLGCDIQPQQFAYQGMPMCTNCTSCGNEMNATNTQTTDKIVDVRIPILQIDQMQAHLQFKKQSSKSSPHQFEKQQLLMKQRPATQVQPRELTQYPHAYKSDNSSAINIVQNDDMPSLPGHPSIGSSLIKKPKKRAGCSVIKDLRIKVKQQKAEISLLLEDNISKDKYIQKLEMQVDRYKKGISYRSPTHSDNERKNDQTMADMSKYYFEEAAKKDQDIKHLKNRLRIQSSQIRTLRDKMEFNKSKSPRSPGRRPKSQISTRSNDLFLVNEQNCKLNEIIDQYKAELLAKERLLVQKQEEALEMSEMALRHQNLAHQHKDQLKKAEEEMEELYVGIKDFQEQAQSIQNDLIQKLNNMKERFQDQEQEKQKLKFEICDIQSQIHRGQYNLPELQQIDNLKRDNARKEKHIAGLERENEQLNEALKKLGSKLEKQNYNNLLNQVTKSRVSTSTPADIMRDSRTFEQTDKTPEQSLRQTGDLTKSPDLMRGGDMQSYKRMIDKFNPKAGIKDIISDKLKSRKEESRSKSIERSCERYQNPHHMNRVTSLRPSELDYSSQRKYGYHDYVDDHKQHTYLSRIGEKNREVLGMVARSSDRHDYQPDSGRRPQNDTHRAQGSAVAAVSPHHLTSEEQFERDKDESIKSLRSRYNQMMRESLERKATAVQEERSRFRS